MALTLQPDGPGTIINLRDGAQGLPSSPRGTAAIFGQFPSGPIDHAALALTPAMARRIAGDPDDTLEASACMSDLYYFDSPPVLVARITDGNAVQAQASIWDRKPDRSYLHLSNRPERAVLGTVKAHNPGRWGGREARLVSQAPLTMSAALTSNTTLATGVTMLVDQYADGQLYLTGDTDGPYRIASNTTAGVLTLEREVGQNVQDAAAGVSNGVTGAWQIVLANDLELGPVIGEDTSRATSFSMSAYRKFKTDGDWERVAMYDGLGLSSSSSKPWANEIIRGEETNGNYQLALSTSYAGENTEDKFPANYCEMPSAVSNATLTVQWYRWSRDDSAGGASTGNPYLESIAVNNSARVVPHKIICTFTAAATFNVSIEFEDGSTVALQSGLTTGSAFACDSHPELCTFNLKSGGTGEVAGDRVVIYVRALPLDLADREAYLYPVAHSDDGNSAQRLRIVSNTYNTVTVRSDLDLSTYGVAASTSPQADGTVDMTSGTWAAGTTLIFTPDGGSAVTFTEPGAGTTNLSAIITELESQDTNDIFSFSDDGSGGLRVELQQSKGAASSITIGNGTANAAFGFTNTDVFVGTDGVPFRIEARWPMWGGYDGGAPTDAQYVLKLDKTDHLLTRWTDTNLGLVRFGTPGVTASAVKTAAEQLAACHGWKYLAEFASSLESGSDPVADAVNNMIANEAESDYVDHVFPSRAQFVSSDKTKLVVRSVFGVWAGIKSKMANVGTQGEKGFHIAAANSNEQGTVSPRIAALTDDIGRWTPSSKKLANDHGIVLLLWSGVNIYLWGNRMYSRGRTPKGLRYTITERDVYYHVARDLFVTTRPEIFRSISQSRLSGILQRLRDKLRVYWRDGWFSDHAGTGFDDQVSVVLPPDQNTAAELLEGNVYAEIEFRPRPALETLSITITPTEVSTS